MLLIVKKINKKFYYYPYNYYEMKKQTEIDPRVNYRLYTLELALAGSYQPFRGDRARSLFRRVRNDRSIKKVNYLLKPCGSDTFYAHRTVKDGTLEFLSYSCIDRPYQYIYFECPKNPKKRLREVMTLSALLNIMSPKRRRYNLSKIRQGLETGKYNRYDN